MALTVLEMREKTKKKRSQAVTGLINVIKTRDGSVSPPIEGIKEVDDFNMSMLFGSSKNEHIDWNNMGVEGLVRLFYKIIEEIDGTKRDNLITSSTTSPAWTENSSLNNAAQRLVNGTYSQSGFFKESPKPEFDADSSSLNDNRWTPTDDYTSSISEIIDEINLILGYKSPIGPHIFEPGSESDWETKINDSIMGKRWTDVCPRSYQEGSAIWGDHDDDPLTPDEIIGYEDDKYIFGNGVYDKDETINNPPSGFIFENHADFWNTDLNLELNDVISRLQYLISDINYSKITDDNYFSNPNVILGKNEDPQFQTQDQWIIRIQNTINAAQAILNELSSYPLSFGKTQVSRRSQVNTLLESFRISINQLNLNGIKTTINGRFGNTSDANTLYGFRFLWVKNILDPNDGSKVAINGLAIAISTMQGNISKSETEFGLYGLSPSEWIPIPNIAGIQTYWLPNSVTLEMEPRGYLIAWEGQDHIVGYNVEKSTDWNGTWNIILPVGNTYTVQNIDANTGRVLTYYIDENVDILGGEKPFYRIKAFDTGGSGEMYRTPAQSATCDPKNVDDFPEGGETVPAIPGSPPTPPPITVPEVPITVPEGTLIWTTILERSDAEDVNFRQYRSEVPFDSSGTNLIVYVNGELRNRGLDQDYVIIDYYTIEFNLPIQSSEEITMNVFIRNPDKDITSWKDSVQNYNQLPQQANSDGDIRLVKDDNAIYQWSGAWILISSSTGNTWGQPVDSISNLPAVGNDGEVRFVISEQSFYYFNGSQNQWLNVASQSMRWKDPVQSLNLLPTSGNITGDVRLILDESKLYLWSGSNWSPIVADIGNITISHSDLEDMPDLAGVIADHDTRYYTENEIDITIGYLQSQINSLMSLIPSDSQKLSGTFRFTGTVFRTGYLSHGSGGFTTLVPEQKFTRITRDVNFTLITADPDQFSNADEGALKLYINDVLVDSFNLGSMFDEDERHISQSYTPATSSNGYIIITEVTSFANYPAYQKGDFRINVKSSDFTPGENKIKLVHELTSEIRESDDFIFFWDNFTTSIGFQSIVVQHEILSSNKFLSGVRHYDLGDQLRINFTALRLFDNTYTYPNQIKIITSQLAHNDFFINYQSPGVSGVTYPEVGKNLHYQSIIPLNVSNITSSNPRLSLIGFDPHGSTSQINSPHQNILINTYSNKSDDKNEYFVDEQYRLSEVDTYNTIPSVITGQWNSQNVLTSGQLQIFNDLVYPTQNYNFYIPNQSVNYTGSSGARHYVRAFRDTQPHNNGTLFINGYNILNLNTKIYIKLSTQTGWLDLSKQYNVADFTGADGDGCLINRSGFSFEWTSGGFSTANSGYFIVVKVTMNNSSSENIGQISIDW